MCDFKVGDKIQVVRSAGSVLEQGEIYTAHEIYLKDGSTYVTLYTDGRKNRDGWDIDRFVKYEEEEKVMKVEMGKKYRMVGTHEPVRIVCTDRKDLQTPIIALGTNGAREDVLYLNIYGKSLHGSQVIEEVPAVDWSKVKVDTPIFVKYAGDLLKRHFNKFDGKHVYFYPDGTTSFTCPEGDPGFTESPDNCWLEEPK